MKDITITAVRSSVEVLLHEKAQINIQFFAKKTQFKVFVTIKSCAAAVKFFETVF